MHIEILEGRRLLAVNLLADAMGFSAAESVTVNGTSYFFADNGNTGKELWKSDGTIAGTQLVKDLTPGAEGTELFAIFRGDNNRAVFITVNRKPHVNGNPNDDFTLWGSDGTSGGTVKLKEFNSTFNLLAKQLGDDRVIILHNVVSPAVEQPPGSTYVDGHLYVTDGSAGGTQEIKTFTALPPGDGKPTQGFMAVAMYNAGERVIFGIGDFQRLWSTDGTAAGTIDVTSPSLQTAINQLQVDISHMVQLQDKVLITSRLNAGSFWTADGTPDGTKALAVNIEGVIPPVENHGVIVNGRYLFEEVHNPGDSENPLPLQKIIHAVDFETGQLEAIYTTSGDGSAQSVNIYQAGDRAIFTIFHNETRTTELWSTDGTADGNVKLAEYTDRLIINQPMTVNGTAFFVLSTLHDATGKSLQLLRTDGRLENTGIVKTIWRSTGGEVATAELSAADGKLLIHTLVQSNGATLYDDTSAYDDRELTFGREGASARLLNGVLHVRGSYHDDRIRIWRSQRMPEKLIVEYNGNERSFLFDSIARINVDLQDGNDYFQILEGEGQVIRLRTSILAGDGSDTIYGGTGRDTIYAGNSGDLIYGRGNADVILAGGGRDRVNAGVGDDQVSGGSGIDRIIAGTGVDVLFGQNAIEMAFGQDVEGEDWDEDVFLG